MPRHHGKANMIENRTVQFDINSLEIAALKKLSLVSHALAEKLDFRAGQEQKVIVTVLDEVIRRIELSR